MIQSGGIPPRDARLEKLVPSYEEAGLVVPAYEQAGHTRVGQQGATALPEVAEPK